MAGLAAVGGAVAGRAMAGGMGPDGLSPGGNVLLSELIERTPTIQAGGLTTNVYRRGPKKIGIPGLDTAGAKLLTQGVTSSAERQGLIRSLSDVFSGAAGEYGGLLSQVAPGFGRLTEARVAGIDAARQRALGDLRDTFSRRRVAGSSFAADTMSRAEEEFGLAESQARAQSFLEELQLSTNLIQQKNQALFGAYQTQLDELNLQADVAMKMSGIAQGVLAATTQAGMQHAALLANQQAQKVNDYMSLGAYAGNSLGQAGSTAATSGLGGAGWQQILGNSLVAGSQ